jgi:hypothetical protein
LQLVAEFLHSPANPNGAGVVLTHGAGANCATPLLIAVADAFAKAGATVLRFDLPFREKRKSGPPFPAGAAADREGIRAAVIRMRALVNGPVVMAGHSYGGRQSSMLAAEHPDLADGLLLLSYPLHPPGKPEKSRTEHFPAIKTPAVFVSGERDDFGSIDEIRAALGSIPGPTRLIALPRAGHDLAKGKFDIADLIVTPVFEALR